MRLRLKRLRPDMPLLDSRGFDLWAESYDGAVSASDGDDSYPFAGYGKVLSLIYGEVMRAGGGDVLDIGFGTGRLTAALYNAGCDIYGQDFSAEMTRVAQEKMPLAHLYTGDIRQGLAAPLAGRRYDFIIATYSLHHLTDNEKIGFIGGLRPLLKEGGGILVGDVAFPSRAALEECRASAGDDWDDSEIYFVYDEIRNAFPDISFTEVSFCAGVFCIPA